MKVEREEPTPPPPMPPKLTDSEEKKAVAEYGGDEWDDDDDGFDDIFDQGGAGAGAKAAPAKPEVGQMRVVHEEVGESPSAVEAAAPEQKSELYIHSEKQVSEGKEAAPQKRAGEAEMLVLDSDF